MKLIQVINGKIAQYFLPKTGTLKSGSTVSGYHLLDEETLQEEGWLPLEDIKPEYNPEMQYIKPTGYDILSDKIIKKYAVYDIQQEQIIDDEIEMVSIFR